MIKKILPLFQMALPLFVSSSFFLFEQQASNLNDPEIPFAFKLLKDCASVVIIMTPFFFTFTLHRIKISIEQVLYVVAPIGLALCALLISLYKYEMDLLILSYIRNLALYYLGAALVVLMAKRFHYEMILFTYFRLFMTASVIIGLLFYLFADNILMFTLNGRMIGTIGSPNFLGFLCFLQIVIIHSLIAYRQKYSLSILLEFTLAMTGMVASMSLAGLLSYVVWLAIFSTFIFFNFIPNNRPLIRFISFQYLVLIFATVVVLVFFKDVIPIFEKIIAFSPEADSAAGRIQSWLAISNEVFGDIKGMLIGSTDRPAYYLWDSSIVNAIYNFGLLFFLLWLLYLVVPILTTIHSWRSLKNQNDFYRSLIPSLALFLFVSVIVNFTTQFTAEGYPTCFIFSWIMYFIFFNTTSWDRSKQQEG